MTTLLRKILTAQAVLLLALCLPLPSLAVCGDGVLDPNIGEQCDVGDADDGDGCSSTCQFEPTPQTKAQQSCIGAMAKGYTKLVRAQSKAICGCSKDFSSGDAASAEACVVADEKGKVAKARFRLDDGVAKRCADEKPDFGLGRVDSTTAIATDHRMDAIRYLFSGDLDGAIISASTDPDAASCQLAVSRAAKKCQTTMLKELAKCTKIGLKLETVGHVNDLLDCLGADGRGKIAKVCNSTTGVIARKVIPKKCDGVTLSTAFPGCGTDDGAELARCVSGSVSCVACVASRVAFDSRDHGCEAAFESGLSADVCGVGSFRGLSYNVAGLPAGISSSEPDINTPLISPLLNGYDLVLVQESWQTPDPNPLDPTRVYHELLAADANHLYKSIPAPQPLGTDPTRETALLSDGLNRFSRYPFTPVVRETWNGCHDTAADCLAMKGFSFARTTIAPGVEIDVYNLHMEAGGDAEDDVLRDEGMTQLITAILANSVGRAVIVGGDFNLHTNGEPDSSTYQRLIDEAGMIDVCATLGCPEPGRIDKFAFRSGDTVSLRPISWKFDTDVFVRDDGEPLSDHEPLAVTYVWELAAP